MTEAARTPSAGAALTYLWQSLSPARRRHLLLVISVMLVGTVAELMTIGAVLPFLALVASPAQTPGVALLQGLAERVGLQGPNGLLIVSATLLIGAALLAVAARLWLMRTTVQFVLLLAHEVATTIFARMLRQPYAYYVKRNSSELLASQEKVQTVVWGVLMPGMQAVTAGVIAMAIVTVLFVIDPFTAAVAAAALAGCYGLVSLAARKRLARNSDQLALTATERMQTMQEGLGGIRDILLEQSQPVFEDKYRLVDLNYRRAQAANNFLSLAPRFVVEGVGIVLLALLTLYFAGRPGGVTAAIPVLGALAVGAQRLLPLLQQAYNGWSAVAGNRQFLIDVADLMQAPVVSSRPRAIGSAPLAFTRAVTLDQVRFRYDDRADVLHGISFEIPKGIRVGIVGETGSGKSTLLDILMGLLDPTGGRLLIDGEPLDDGNRANWQAQIAHVPQAIYLADSSIAANIAFGEGADSIDLARVEDAARRAQLHDFIRGLPARYETSVGERGVRLSGGQRQRIGIARALYKRASVLVFDEATSALDSRVEAGIMRSIFALDHDLTMLMIAHRTTTLAGCERIIRLDQGRIVEDGSYEAVLGGAPPGARVHG